MKTQHHLLRLSTFFALLFFAMSLFAQKNQNKTLREVWTNMRPVNGTSTWKLEGEALPINGYVIFTVDSAKGEMYASFVTAEVTKPEPAGSPSANMGLSNNQLNLVDWNLEQNPESRKLRNILSFWIFDDVLKAEVELDVTNLAETINGTVKINSELISISAKKIFIENSKKIYIGN